jgi:hypothetical protein
MRSWAGRPAGIVATRCRDQGRTFKRVAGRGFGCEDLFADAPVLRSCCRVTGEALCARAYAVQLGRKQEPATGQHRR